MSTAVTEHAAAAPVARNAGWLRGATFDANFIGTVALAAVASGLVAMLEPRLAPWVLIADVWLLGYHHVVSTFTRLVFDRESFRQHRFLVLYLPLIVLGVTIAAVLGLGIWVLPTVYLYWQWFHYTRQSYGIERIYRRKAGEGAAIHDYISTRSLYLVPLFGILYRSWQAQPEFLGTEVVYLPVSVPMLVVVGILASATLGWWIAHQAIALLQGRLPLAHFLYLVSHHAIFITGYVLIEDITTGWLVLNVWHNLQYILIVWLFNNNRFKDGVSKQHWFLSTISQTRNFAVYIGVCLAISTLVYFVLNTTTMKAGYATAIPVTLIVFMVINFHHYVVDSVIWKVRKKKVRTHLGIQT